MSLALLDRRMAFRKYWPRLVATCMAWVANDFAFYGEGQGPPFGWPRLMSS